MNSSANWQMVGHGSHDKDSYNPPKNQSGSIPVPPPPPPSHAIPQFPPQRDTKDLIRVFNTAMVATRGAAERDFSKEIFQLMESPAFKAILMAVHYHAKATGLSEDHAAEELIRTFRLVDQSWADYVYQQGVAKIQGE